jgi:hypothetical protein
VARFAVLIQHGGPGWLSFPPPPCPALQLHGRRNACAPVSPRVPPARRWAEEAAWADRAPEPAACSREQRAVGCAGPRVRELTRGLCVVGAEQSEGVHLGAGMFLWGWRRKTSWRVLVKW